MTWNDTTAIKLSITECGITGGVSGLPMDAVCDVNTELCPGYAEFTLELAEDAEDMNSETRCIAPRSPVSKWLLVSCKHLT